MTFRPEESKIQNSNNEWQNIKFAYHLKSSFSVSPVINREKENQLLSASPNPGKPVVRSSFQTIIMIAGLHISTIYTCPLSPAAAAPILTKRSCVLDSPLSWLAGCLYTSHNSRRLTLIVSLRQARVLPLSIICCESRTRKTVEYASSVIYFPFSTISAEWFWFSSSICFECFF